MHTSASLSCQERSLLWVPMPDDCTTGAVIKSQSGQWCTRSWIDAGISDAHLVLVLLHPQLLFDMLNHSDKLTNYIALLGSFHSFHPLISFLLPTTLWTSGQGHSTGHQLDKQVDEKANAVVASTHTFMTLLQSVLHCYHPG